MHYKVTYMMGDKVREAVMSQGELDECRAGCEVVEAIPLTSNEQDPAV